MSENENVDAAARERAQAAMRPSVGRIGRMVGEGRIVVEGPTLEEVVVTTSGLTSLEPTAVLRPQEEPENDSRAVVVTLSDPHWPGAKTDIALPEGEQNPYITEREQAAARLGLDPQLFDAVRSVLGHGLADARHEATYSTGRPPAALDASQAQVEAAELTVYTTPDCPGCQLTTRQLDKAGVAYESIDLSGRPDLVEQFRSEGLLQAPIIETSDGQRTAGFDPARIKAIVAAATPQQAPGTPGPSDGGDGGSRPSRAPQQQRSRTRGEGMHQ